MSRIGAEARWIPLLTGRAAERALEAVEEIAAELPEATEPNIEDRPGRGASLAGGCAGFALFYGYLARVTGDEAHAETAARYLDQAIDAVAAQVTRPGLYSGFTGVAWVAEHLTGRIFEPEDDEEDANEEVDRAVAALLDQTPWRADYDLISGLVGFGVYALERRHRPAGRAILERVVERLDELAVPNGDGLTWFTPPEILPPHQREQSPEGCFNVGVAHGVPAVLPLLARTAAASVSRERARALLDGGVRWLQDEKGRVEGVSLFPYSIGTGGSRHPSRLAWCYGDLGVAAALLDAAASAGEPAWWEEAVDIAHHAARRSWESAGVHDACLCHGAAGNAHVFNRLYQATRDNALGAAARAWFDRALELRRPGEGVAGFPSWGPQQVGEEPRWTDDASFLTGAGGVGLALLAAVTDVAPDWDRVLAISVPPAPP
ncbi:MAG: lanthionine synthetase C family protein [Thermoanaerobaculia bacterium]